MSEGFDYFGLAAGLAFAAFPKPELSSVTGILDVADQGNALQQGRSLCVGDEGVSGAVEGHGEQIRASHIEQGQFLTANGGIDQIAKSCNKSENPASPADSQILSAHCHRVSEFTLYERVTAVMADAAFIQSAKFWGKVIAKCEDVSLAEGYRLEELDAEREGASL